MRFFTNRTATIVLLGAIAAFSIHVVNRWLEPARADLTQDDLYSLSGGTKRILERLNEEGVKPIDITLYFSETAGKTLPKFIKEFISYERYLRALLREYERRSAGKIRVATADPVPDSDLAQAAADAGLEGKMINQEGDQFYFGLAFETQTGSREAIEFLWPNEQENIEYEITKTIHRLLWPQRKRVGVISSLEVLGSADDPYMAQMLQVQGRQPTPKWISMQLLEEVYQVSRVADDAEVISRDDYDLLVVIHPKDLSQRQLFAIDRWVAGGGNALVFLDPYALDDEPPGNAQQPWMALQYERSSDLAPLLRAWGLERVPHAFAADFELAVRRAVSSQGPAESVIVDLVIDNESPDETLPAGSPVLQGMNSLRFLLAGVIEPVEPVEGAASPPAGVEVVPLVQTTKAGNSLQVMPGFGGGDGDTLGYTDFNNPARLRDVFAPGSQPRALVYLVRGKLPSAYPQGIDYPANEPERPPGLPPGIELPPPEGAEMVHQDPLPESERKEAAVIVFADVDFIADRIAFVQNPFGMLQAANDNHRVLLNAADFLLGAQELMTVRAKRPLRRPFVLFDQIESKAERETLERERQIRDDVADFEEQLRTKQSEITARNAALFEKKVLDEVDELNKEIRAGNDELKEIRKDRRAALLRQEGMVRFSMLGWMPIVVLALGVYRAIKRRREAAAPEPAAPAAAPAADGGAR